MGKSLNKFLSQLSIGEVVSFKNKEGKYSSTIHVDIQNKLDLINPDAIYIYKYLQLVITQ